MKLLFLLSLFEGHSPEELWIWGGFILFVVLCLVLDLGVFNKKDHVIGTREAMLWTTLWVSISLAFTGVIYWIYAQGFMPNPENHNPTQAVVTYLTGYIMELSLSFDNVFVIALIFASFRIPAKYQHRVLFYGIIGAVFFRGLAIYFGVALINRIDWLIYVLGAFLLFTAIKMLGDDEMSDPQESWLYKQIGRVFPLTKEIDGHKFFIKRNAKYYATPLFSALIIIEFSDILFALDSIPAILAITKDEFLIFSSNILAILGLRSMFFLIISIMRNFRYINYSLAAILAFVGVKILIQDFYEIPVWVSLLVILVAMTAGILVSMAVKEKEDK